RQSRLSRARRAPEDERGKLAARHGAPEEAPCSQEILLALELLEFAGAHALGERGAPGAALLVFGKEIQGIGHASSALRSGEELKLDGAAPGPVELAEEDLLPAAKP